MVHLNDTFNIKPNSMHTLQVTTLLIIM